VFCISDLNPPQVRPLLVHALETGEFEEFVDSRLENFFVKSEMMLMIEAAAACVRHSASKRPRMAQVPNIEDVFVITGTSTTGKQIPHI